MPTHLNVALQLLALIVAVAIRLAQPGWWVILVIIFVIPIVGAALPLVLAIATARRQWLTRAVALPFGANAVGLVAVALLFPEFDDQTWWVPALQAVGAPRPDSDAAHLIGYLAVLGYSATLVWSIAAIITTHQPRMTPTGPRLPAASA